MKAGDFTPDSPYGFVTLTSLHPVAAAAGILNEQLMRVPLTTVTPFPAIFYVPFTRLRLCCREETGTAQVR